MPLRKRIEAILKRPFFEDCLQAVRILYRCMGVLFVFEMAMMILREVICYPVFRKLWELSIRTIPKGYLTDSNFLDAFRYPAVILSGILIVIGFCFLCVWELSGIELCLECSYRGKRMNIVNAFRLAPVRIAHSKEPRNLAIFLYACIVKVSSDIKGIISSIYSIPIPGYIVNHNAAGVVRGILLAATALFFVYIHVRFIFVREYYILEKRSFWDSVRLSRKKVGQSVVNRLSVIPACAIATVCVYVVPALALTLVYFLTAEFLRGYTYAWDVARTVFLGYGRDILSEISMSLAKMFLMAYVLVLYHRYRADGVSELSERFIPKKKNPPLRFVVWAVVIGLVVAGPVATFVLTNVAEIAPEAVVELLGTMKIAAHKGCSAAAPENTMDAFDLAADNDTVDYIELDVRETADGIPVVIHDANLLAAAGEKISVYALTYEELCEYNACYRFKHSFLDVKIPTLESVLEKYAGVKPLIIEIKDSLLSPDLPGRVVDLMRKYDCVGTCMVQSGSYKVIRTVKEIDPDIRCGYIVTVYTGGYESLPYADFFTVEHSFLTAGTVERIHDYGKEVFAWTTNDRASVERMRDIDVDAVITDHPERVYKWIHARSVDLVRALTPEVADPIVEESEEISTEDE